jgi:hypothetical protein
MRVAVNLDSSRAADAAPAPAYPDICFAVDEFDEAHSHMVRGPQFLGFRVVSAAEKLVLSGTFRGLLRLLLRQHAAGVRLCSGLPTALDEALA